MVRNQKMKKNKINQSITSQTLALISDLIFTLSAAWIMFFLAQMILCLESKIAFLSSSFLSLFKIISNTRYTGDPTAMWVRTTSQTGPFLRV